LPSVGAETGAVVFSTGPGFTVLVFCTGLTDGFDGSVVATFSISDVAELVMTFSTFTRKICAWRTLKIRWVRAITRKAQPEQHSTSDLSEPTYFLPDACNV
jgi:hypothetical protein